ncbi:MAG: N-acetylneuraminate synthase [Bacteroidaceae bacterium]|nr:N-acetylneuraminate synthase [Bacteroidaceae bacterium]
MSHTLIIAEAGVNHNGSIEMAKQLVEKAVEAGVDYIKFQTFKASKLVTKSAKQAEYQQRNIGSQENSQYQMLKKLELSPEEHQILIDYCHQLGIKFFSTAFDFDSIEYLHSLDLGLWKIPSGEVTNYPFLKRIAAYNEKTILSTGMCDMQDVRNAVEALYKNGLSKENLILLHCNTEYPTPFEDVNLKSMDALRKEFGVEVGYSDHTKGIEVPIAAVALGATVIEKHFTLDRTLPGPDHKASLEPDELKAMVSAIRNIEKAVGGDGTKHVSESERKNIAIARKSIVAACDIKAGEVFTEDNLTVKRPGSGISPMRWEEVLGMKAKRDFAEDELIEI